MLPIPVWPLLESGSGTGGTPGINSLLWDDGTELDWDDTIELDWDS